MQVFQTAGVPPRRGSTILAKSGSTKKRSAALRKTVSENRSRKGLSPVRLPERAYLPSSPPLSAPFEAAAVAPERRRQSFLPPASRFSPWKPAGRAPSYVVKPWTSHSGQTPFEPPGRLPPQSQQSSSPSIGPWPLPEPPHSGQTCEPPQRQQGPSRSMARWKVPLSPGTAFLQESHQLSVGSTGKRQ